VKWEVEIFKKGDSRSGLLRVSFTKKKKKKRTIPVKVTHLRTGGVFPLFGTKKQEKSKKEVTLGKNHDRWQKQSNLGERHGTGPWKEKFGPLCRE